MSCICVRVYQLNHIVLRLLIFYVYEFRRIQTRGEFNFYFRRSRDFFSKYGHPVETNQRLSVYRSMNTSCRPFRSPKYLFHKLLVTALRINWVIKLSIFAGYLRAPSGAHLGLIRLPGRYHCLSPPRQRPAVCQ